MTVKSKNNSETINQPEEETEKYWPQIVAILIGSLSGITEGLFFGWTSPFLSKLTEDKVNYDINAEQVTLFNTIYPLGMIVSCPIFGIVGQKVGKKKIYLFTIIPQLLSWLLAAFGKNVWFFYASRFSAGISGGCFLTIFPAYIGEITNPKVRGSWGNLLSTSLYVGQVIINVIGIFCGVQTSSFICLPLPIIFVILFYFMPESPYYYIMKDNEEEAKKSLRFLTRMKNIDDQYLKLKAGVKRQVSESGSWLDILKIASNRKGVMAGLFLRLTQPASGSSLFMQYTQYIFEKSGGNIDHQTASVIYTSLIAISNILVLLFFVHRFGRRILIETSLASSGLLMYILGIYFYLDQYSDIDLTSVNWIPVSGMILYVIFTAIGIGCVPALMMSELYSASIKPKAMILSSIVFAGGNLVINNIFYYLNVGYGFYAPFFFFAACNTVATIVSFFIVPETKGKTLEEIQQMLKMKKNVEVKITE